MGPLEGSNLTTQLGRFVVAACLIAGGASSARAAVDLNGPWRILAQTAPYLNPNVECIVTIVQAGTSLSVTGIDCSIAINLSGTIDPDTGAFSASGPSDPFLCPTLEVSGSATLASDAFDGSFSCNGIIPVLGPFSGGLCGNGEMNAGEDCDDGDVDDYDCCSPTCDFDPVGWGCFGDHTRCTEDRCDGAGACVSTPDANGERCEEDGNSCTDDICNATGTCTHPLRPAGASCFVDFNTCTDDVCDAGGTCVAVNNTAPCDDYNTCTIGDTCAAGACVPGTSFAPAGVRCNADANHCTVDACDAAGGCVNQGCSLCCGGPGCTPKLSSCTAPTAPVAKLRMKRRHDDPTGDKLIWKWPLGGATSVNDFGDPLTSTAYELCIYEQEHGTQTLLFLEHGATAPAGGMCSGAPCWKATGTSGFAYHDPELTPFGLDRIRLRPGPVGEAQILVKSKGANVGFTRLDHIRLPLTVQLKASNGKCWGSTFTSAKQSFKRLSAKDGQ